MTKPEAGGRSRLGNNEALPLYDNAQKFGRCAMARHCPISCETILELDGDLMFIQAYGPLICKIEAKMGRPVLGLTTQEVFEMFGGLEGQDSNPVPRCLDGEIVTWQRPVGNQIIHGWAHPKYNNGNIVGVVMHLTTVPVGVTV